LDNGTTCDLEKLPGSRIELSSWNFIFFLKKRDFVELHMETKIHDDISRQDKYYN